MRDETTETVGDTGQEQIQFNKTEFFEQRKSDAESKASQHGWKDFDAHIDNGGNPEQWLSAEVFNARGDAIKTTMRQKSNHRNELNKQIHDLNEVHEVSLEINLQKMLKERIKAIEQGDTDVVSDLDKDIDKTKDGIEKVKASKQVASTVDKDLIDHEARWRQDNPWFDAVGAKGAYARSLVVNAVSSGYHGEDLTNYLEQEVAKEFPPRNTNRDKPSISDKGGKRSKDSVEALTMDSLNKEDSLVAQSLMNRGKSEEDVLKMIKLSRK